MRHRIISAILFSLIVLSFFHFYEKHNAPKQARIRQINGVGEKIIKDSDNEWEVLPFKVGDTISPAIISKKDMQDAIYEALSFGQVDYKNYVVIEIKQ